ncbi:MAG TPA: DeoR/GlpR family DNA-binding transcription regulator [Chitinophagaceae bacterium]|nr:DeoR/GlpR family DNA-binding transcription regulator [Chitinophagaceae bacterium]
MLKEERFNHILKVIKKRGKVFYETLSEDLNISEDTARRDIESLHNNGLLFKVRGGAISVSRNPLSFQDRSQYLPEEKEWIALKAQQLIKKGQTIFMDGGSTICAIANHLPANSSFRLVTNNMALIPIISKFKGIELIILGGIHNRETATNTGGQTCQEVKQYIASLYFMGTCALQKDFGISAVFQNDGEVKRSMLRNANKTFALVNSSNLNTTEHYKVCDIKDIGGMITELATDDPKLDDFRHLGIRLI